MGLKLNIKFKSRAKQDCSFLAKITKYDGLSFTAIVLHSLLITCNFYSHIPKWYFGNWFLSETNAFSIGWLKGKTQHTDVFPQSVITFTPSMAAICAFQNPSKASHLDYWWAVILVAVWVFRHIDDFFY
jgi:hypothetical protein